MTVEMIIIRNAAHRKGTHLVKGNGDPRHSTAANVVLPSAEIMFRTLRATFQGAFGRPMATIDDLYKYFTDTQKSKYAGVDLNWWVPRRLEGSPTLTYPD